MPRPSQRIITLDPDEQAAFVRYAAIACLVCGLIGGAIGYWLGSR